MAKKKLTVESSMADFKRAYRAKKKLLDRQKEDFLFRFGKQWTDEKEQKLKDLGFQAVVDNRIQPNIFLITGLERQNRSDFKAYPEGEEDSLKAEIASALFKDSIRKSDFEYKSSESFEDSVTCGESHLELYLDNTYSLTNGKPCWKKINSNQVFQDPASKEYDFSDAKFVYKLTVALEADDLISMFPEKQGMIERMESDTLDVKSITGDDTKHNQPRDYAKTGEGSGGEEMDDRDTFDLIERHYRKWVEKYFIGDKHTGKLEEAQDKESAESFMMEYRAKAQQEASQLATAQEQAQADPTGQAQQLVSTLQPRDPERFIIIKRMVSEMWYFAHTPGMKEPLADEVAWYYPKWKNYPIVPCFAHFSTAPIEGEHRHLLVQGIVHPVKGVQQKHNSVETLKLMHINSVANSGWLAEENSWVDEKKVQDFGAAPGVNLEYKKGSQPPQRIHPMELSQAHTQIAAESAEAIKQILGINADLLAVQEGGQSSGRAIALRQKQGLLMIQKLFDNLSRTKQICGKFLLSQLGEIYDTETAKKVLGEAFLQKNFPPPMLLNEQTGQPEPQKDAMGQPMEYDKDLAEIAIAEVLSGELGAYDVAVGEAVASETMKLANAAELQDLAAKLPGLIPPDLLVEESQLQNTTKNRILSAIKQSQAELKQKEQLSVGAA